MYDLYPFANAPFSGWLLKSMRARIVGPGSARRWLWLRFLRVATIADATPKDAVSLLQLYGGKTYSPLKAFTFNEYPPNPCGMIYFKKPYGYLGSISRLRSKNSTAIT